MSQTERVQLRMEKRDYITLSARLFLSLIFLVAGFQKFRDVPGLAETIYNYRLLPSGFVVLAAQILPTLEITVGVFLLVGFLLPGAALLSAGLSGAFAVGVGSAVVRGLNIDCGCFSFESNVSWGHVLFNLFCMALSIFLALKGSTKWSLDQSFEVNSESGEMDGFVSKGLMALCGVSLLFNTAYISHEAGRSRATQQPVQNTATGEQPVFHPDRVEHDFGKIKQGETYPTTFKFSNQGNATLVVTNVETSCGCTAAEPSKKRLEPGEEAEIGVKFDPRSDKGPFRKFIKVHTNAQGSPHGLAVQGDIEPLFIAEPERLYMEELANDFTLRFRAADPEMKFRITGITKSLPELTVTGGAPPDQSVHEVQFNVRLEKKPGRPSGALFILTDHPKMERFIIPVFPGRRP